MEVQSITRDKVMKRIAPVETGTPELWFFIQQLIDDCVTAGYLQETAAK
jgi:putative hydrolases of HD superfamily